MTRLMFHPVSPASAVCLESGKPLMVRNDELRRIQKAECIGRFALKSSDRSPAECSDQIQQHHSLTRMGKLFFDVRGLWRTLFFFKWPCWTATNPKAEKHVYLSSCQITGVRLTVTVSAWHSMFFYDSVKQKKASVRSFCPHEMGRQLTIERGKRFQIDCGKLRRNSSCVWPRVESPENTIVHPKCVSLAKEKKNISQSGWKFQALDKRLWNDESCASSLVKIDFHPPDWSLLPVCCLWHRISAEE